jgi:hypothetical protein
MKKWSFVALLLLGAAILGATVLREPVAWAAQSINANITGPLDGQGNVKVHEQGTTQVAGTIGLSTSANSVKIDPTNTADYCYTTSSCSLQQEIEASLITVDLQANVGSITLTPGAGNPTLYLQGPGETGQSHYVLPLTQPIRVRRLDVYHPTCISECGAFVSVAGTPVP